MTDWMKQRDLLIDETLAFVQGVAANSKLTVATARPVAGASTADIFAQNPVETKVQAPVDKLNMERASILLRVADFKANQQRFQREREEYFAGTMAKARANRWPMPDKL